MKYALIYLFTLLGMCLGGVVGAGINVLLQLGVEGFFIFIPAVVIGGAVGCWFGTIEEEL